MRADTIPEKKWETVRQCIQLRYGQHASSQNQMTNEELRSYLKEKLGFECNSRQLVHRLKQWGLYKNNVTPKDKKELASDGDDPNFIWESGGDSGGRMVEPSRVQSRGTIRHTVLHDEPGTIMLATHRTRNSGDDYDYDMIVSGNFRTRCDDLDKLSQQVGTIINLLLMDDLTAQRYQTTGLEYSYQTVGTKIPSSYVYFPEQPVLIDCINWCTERANRINPMFFSQIKEKTLGEISTWTEPQRLLRDQFMLMLLHWQKLARQPLEERPSWALQAGDSDSCFVTALFHACGIIINGGKEPPNNGIGNGQAQMSNNGSGFVAWNNSFIPDQYGFTSLDDAFTGQTGYLARGNPGWNGGLGFDDQMAQENRASRSSNEAFKTKMMERLEIHVSKTLRENVWADAMDAMVKMLPGHVLAGEASFA